MKKLKDELAAAKELVVIFDGTTYCAEALAILFRYISADDWTIQQRLVSMHVLAKSLSGPQLARSLGRVCRHSFSCHLRRSLRQSGMEQL